MPANRNALIRYKTIDTCLRNRYRQWTLEDLIDACSDALYEFEGIDKGISRRTIQMDILMMRSEKLGYNAPIVVYIQTKPVHKTQQLLEQLEDGSAVFEINVVINQELQREFFGYADGIQVLEPQYLREFMKQKLEKAANTYDT